MIAALLGVGIAFVVAGSLTAPLRALATTLDRIAAGDTTRRSPRWPTTSWGASRNARTSSPAPWSVATGRWCGVVDAVGTYSPRKGADRLVDQAIADAKAALGLIDARIVLGDPSAIPEEERVPGEALPVRADLRAGAEPLGVLVGRAPATARWDRADQDLLELFAAVVGVGLRNAELFTRVADQNERLQELDAAKDDFLRGVSHNLRHRSPASGPTPTSWPPSRWLPDARPAPRDHRRAERPALADGPPAPDREPTDSGVLRPVAEVFGLGPRVRRAWEALGATGIPFTLDDLAGGWVAYADPDQIDQVIWALLDNAVKYGGGAPITVAWHSTLAAGARPWVRSPARVEARRAPCVSRWRIRGRGSRRQTVGNCSSAIPAAPNPAPRVPAWASTSRASWRGSTAATSMLEPSTLGNDDQPAGNVSGPSSTRGATFVLTIPAESPTEA